MKNKLFFKKGFTLIELLVVISIISLLSSVVLVSLSGVKPKARDAVRIAEFNEIQKAMMLYFDKYGSYPGNNTGGDNTYAVNFDNMAQTLVNEGFLGSVPVSPCGQDCPYYNGGYAYFNYGPPPGIGQAFIITFLETAPDTTTGLPPSCRQSIGSSNFCYSSSNKQYCMCFPNS